ncbi:tumor necrosis factor ligand superfamily member 9 [Dasypus novemcinctus]|uniref:tumor necrosis factor ligand superfamily member 9 n=1 Tax=Dasypus novemcinctus TaxID=9361 RepID=UPI00265EDEE2|nr:tumor necrosis factor ligand superfamily member 9 [Dasypus novemcinctus]
MRCPTDACPDPEAPRPPAPPGRACRPLDWALGAALLLLAATCAAACAARSWAVPGVPGQPSPTSSPRLPELPPGDPRAGLLPDRRQGGFAQLVASNESLTNGSLHWLSGSHLKGVTLAPDLRYDSSTQELVVAAAGVYYVFLSLELRRRVVGVDPGPGWVSVALHVQPPPVPDTTLELTVALPSLEAGELAVGSRGHLLHLDAGQRLSAHLRISGPAGSFWQLSKGSTTLGLFLVAAEGPLGLPPRGPT